MKFRSLFIQHNNEWLVGQTMRDRLNVIETSDVDVAIGVIGRLLGLPAKSLADTDDVFALATVVTDEVYSIEARRYGWWDDGEDMEMIVRESGSNDTHMTVLLETKTSFPETFNRSDGGSNCTAEYLASIRQSVEEDELVCFADFARERYPHRLHSYRFDERGERNNVIAEITDGFGTTRSFRQYWTAYVRSFVPVRLRDDKPYVLSLTMDGRFIVTHETTGEEVSLSETESLLYHLRCFYCLADFWSGAQELRRIDPIDKPLLVSGLFERLDEALDRQPFLDIMESCNRQTILLVPKTVRDA